MFRLAFRSVVLAFGLFALGQGQAFAALTTFQQYTGTVGYSTDGFGSLSNSGTISASVPAGSTVLAAYLYTATFLNPTNAGIGSTLEGVNVAYGPAVPNPSSGACCLLSSARADVTSIVAPIINGGPGGVYNFTVTEASASQDGEVLVVVYSNPGLPEATVGILDGFSNVAGDSTSINFVDPLDPTDPGFFAEMILASSFSCCGQRSEVSVNGTLISANAGNNDDGVQVANGSLITVGSFDDPFSPFLPSYADDHERYNLVPYVTAGDTSISVLTRNPDATDNIFLAGFYVSGIAGINEPPPTTTGPVPEPALLALLGAGLATVAARRSRRAR
jgi:hypothetical protein